MLHVEQYQLIIQKTLANRICDLENYLEMVIRENAELKEKVNSLELPKESSVIPFRNPEEN